MYLQNFLQVVHFFLVFIFKFKVLRSFRISNQIKKEINFIFSIPETLKKCHQRIEWLLFFNAAFIHKCFHHSCLSGMAARFIDGGSLVLCKSHRLSAIKGPRLHQSKEIRPLMTKLVTTCMVYAWKTLWEDFNKCRLKTFLYFYMPETSMHGSVTCLKL